VGQQGTGPPAARWSDELFLSLCGVNGLCESFELVWIVPECNMQIYR
jgi:hypothetical protein